MESPKKGRYGTYVRMPKSIPKELQPAHRKYTHVCRFLLPHCTDLEKVRRDRNGVPIEMRMTFEQWYGTWQESGKWEQRGFQKGQYVMARKDDLGHYELGNVEIILHTENSSQTKGRSRPKHTMEARKKMSDAANVRAALKNALKRGEEP